MSERLAFPLRELKLSGDGARTFSGYGSVFGVMDGHGDVIIKGAFARTLNEHNAAGSMPVMLAQHGAFGGESDMPVGAWLSMREDDVGLRVEGRLSDTERGRECYTLLRDKALTGLSIGFATRDFKPGIGGAARTLTDLDLIEVSLVSFPSNRLARVDGVKRADGGDFSIRDAERALRDAGLSRELAKAIIANGWRAATERRDDVGDASAILGALREGAASLSYTIKQRTRNARAHPGT